VKIFDSISPSLDFLFFAFRIQLTILPASKDYSLLNDANKLPPTSLYPNLIHFCASLVEIWKRIGDLFESP
jgi:hypothetical protein